MNVYIKNILKISDAIADILTRVTGTSLSEFNNEQILEKASIFKEEPIPFMTLSEYRAFSELGSSCEYDKKYRQRRERMLVLILAEAISRSGQYTDAIADAMWAIAEESSWILPADTSLSPTAPSTDVPEVIDTSSLHGVSEDALGTAVIFAAITHSGLMEKLFEISDILPERVEWEINSRCITPFLNLGYASGVDANHNEALLYVAAAVGAKDAIARRIEHTK